MNEEITIREGRLSDIDEVARLHEEFLFFHSSMYDDVFYAQTNAARQKWRNWLTRTTRNGEVGLFVAETSNGLVGYVTGWIQIRPPIYLLTRIGFLSNLYVKQEFKNLGIGTRLNQAIIDWFKDHDILYVELNADSRAKESLQAWFSLGYEEVGKRMRKQI